MYDQTLEFHHQQALKGLQQGLANYMQSWTTIKKDKEDINLHEIKEILCRIISSNPSIDDSQSLLEEFSPTGVLRKINLDDDEKELVREEVDEQSKNSIVRTRLIPDFFIDDSRSINFSSLSNLDVITGDDYNRSRHDEIDEVKDNPGDVLDLQLL